MILGVPRLKHFRVVKFNFISHSEFKGKGSDIVESDEVAYDDPLYLDLHYLELPYLFGYKTGLSLSRMSTNNQISPMQFCCNTDFTLPKTIPKI